MNELSARAAARGDHLLLRLVDFGHFLWELGLDVGPERIAEAVASIPLIELGRRDEFATCLRACFVARHEDDALFTLAFTYFWGDHVIADRQALDDALAAHGGKRLALPSQRTPRTPAQAQESRPMAGRGQRHPYMRLADARHPHHSDDGDDADGFGAYSREEVLRHKDFEDFSWQELQQAKEFMARKRWHLGMRRTRRLRSARRGRQLDLRRTLRASLRAGGEPLTLARRVPREQPRPLVILCDISGSMSLYSRLLLHFIHTVATGLRAVETFVFGTRLTRITRQLARHDVDAAVRDVTHRVRDWSGGTRIGESLRSYNRLWARRTLGHGAVVLIISDGWDRGDVRILGQEMQRLQRNCHRLLWLNPLLGQQDYLPTTAGMRAALPYIDDFLPAHNLDSLLAVSRALEAVDAQRRPLRRAWPALGTQASGR